MPFQNQFYNCPTCGAAVWNKKLHDEWHSSLKNNNDFMIERFKDLSAIIQGILDTLSGFPKP